MVENFTSFSSLHKCVPDHIQHRFSAFMKEKTVSVSGLIYKAYSKVLKSTRKIFYECDLILEYRNRNCVVFVFIGG